jgi:FlaA1/EpsC-like NDP-sugar epimerase
MEVAEEFGVERFVLISTDKAVNPTNFMGASKRIAELLLQAMAKKSRFTKFSAVRFGNVLESRGSAVPLFKEQVKKGELITLTHPETTRYFMTLSEAAQLVIQAGAIGKGGEIFVLNMGEQIKIIDLARDLIRLSGFEPDVDIKMKIIGLRPGEKLHEELVGKDEKVQSTSHEKIMSIKSNNEVNGEELRKRIEELERLAVSEDVEGVVRKIKEIEPEFNHQKIASSLRSSQ